MFSSLSSSYWKSVKVPTALRLCHENTFTTIVIPRLVYLVEFYVMYNLYEFLLHPASHKRDRQATEEIAFGRLDMCMCVCMYVYVYVCVCACIT